jgi:hypothetical protein
MDIALRTLDCGILLLPEAPTFPQKDMNATYAKTLDSTVNSITLAEFP